MNVSVNLYKPICTFKIEGGKKMKRKLALIIAAVMTVATVPSVAFASTKLTAVDEIKVATDKKFTSNIELSKSNDQVDVKATKTVKGRPAFDIYVTLTNGKFYYHNDDDGTYLEMTDLKSTDMAAAKGILAVEKESDTKIKVTLDADVFNQSDVKQDPDKLVEPTEVKKPNKDDYKAVAPKAPEEVKEPNEADYPNDSAGLYNAWQKYYSYKDKLKAYEKELAEYESGAAQKAKDEEYAEALAKYEEYVEAKKAYDEAKENQKDGADVADACVLPIIAKADEVGDVVAKGNKQCFSIQDSFRSNRIQLRQVRLKLLQKALRLSLEDSYRR